MYSFELSKVYKKCLITSHATSVQFLWDVRNKKVGRMVDRAGEVVLLLVRFSANTMQT